MPEESFRKKEIYKFPKCESLNQKFRNEILEILRSNSNGTEIPDSKLVYFYRQIIENAILFAT